MEEEVLLHRALAKDRPEVNVNVSIAIGVGMMHDVVIPPIRDVVDAADDLPDELRPLVCPPRVSRKRSTRGGCIRAAVKKKPIKYTTLARGCSRA